MNYEFEEQKYDNTLDALIDLLNRMPAETVKMIDLERYKTMLQTASELKDILAENQEEGMISIEILDRFNMGSIETELDDLTVTNTSKFAFLIAQADNFEIYPKTNGKIQLNITFQSVLKIVG